MAGFPRMSPLQALKVLRLALLVPGVFTFTMVTAIPARANTTEVTDLLNRLRMASSKCAGTPGLEKLVRSAELDRAATMMAGGASLKDSGQATGYQALPLQGINISGSANAAALEQLLSNGYCPLIVDPSYSEVGVHQRGTSTWVVLSPAFAPAGGKDDAAVSSLVMKLVNDARARGQNCGGTFYPPAAGVRLNEALTRSARAHSDDMARNSFFSHTSRDGTSSADRVERAGYDYRSTAENIAAGQMTAEAAMAAWLSSPGHCANLMDAAFTEMGVAHSSNRHSQQGVYWTQVFGVQRVARAVRTSQPARATQPRGL